MFFYLKACKTLSHSVCQIPDLQNHHRYHPSKNFRVWWGIRKGRAVVVRGPLGAPVRFAPCLPLCPLCADLLCSLAPLSVLPRYVGLALLCPGVPWYVRFDTKGYAGIPLTD